jgi:hypothetical protein
VNRAADPDRLIAARAYGHYFRYCPYDAVDVYRMLELFDVDSPAIAHAIKKLLAAGQRGAKDARRDVAEARDALDRWLEMRDEDVAAQLR